MYLTNQRPRSAWHWVRFQLPLVLLRLIRGKCWRCKGTGRVTWYEFSYRTNPEMECKVCKGTGVRS